MKNITVQISRIITNELYTVITNLPGVDNVTIEEDKRTAIKLKISCDESAYKIIQVLCLQGCGEILEDAVARFMVRLTSNTYGMLMHYFNEESVINYTDLIDIAEQHYIDFFKEQKETAFYKNNTNVNDIDMTGVKQN